MPNQQCQSNAGVPFATTLSTHTHTHLTALCPGLPRWAGTRKVKPIWILLKQETVSGSGISWAICKSAPRSRQITTPVLHYWSFLQAGCPSCRPTNCVKALKGKQHYQQSGIITNKLPWKRQWAGHIMCCPLMSHFEYTDRHARHSMSPSKVPLPMGVIQPI